MDRKFKGFEIELFCNIIIFLSLLINLMHPCLIKVLIYFKTNLTDLRSWAVVYVSFSASLHHFCLTICRLSLFYLSVSSFWSSWGDGVWLCEGGTVNYSTHIAECVCVCVHESAELNLSRNPLQGVVRKKAWPLTHTHTHIHTQTHCCSVAL